VGHVHRARYTQTNNYQQGPLLIRKTAIQLALQDGSRLCKKYAKSWG
jgi:hypothetical protein